MTGNPEDLVVPRPGNEIARGALALFQALTTREWTSLAVICSESGSRAWWLVKSLEQVAAQAHRPIRTVNVLDVTAARATAIAHALSPAKLRAGGTVQRYLVATDSPLLNPAALGVISICDGALLLLHEGRTHIPVARSLVELIGRERLMGAVLGSW